MSPKCPSCTCSSYKVIFSFGGNKLLECSDCHLGYLKSPKIKKGSTVNYEESYFKNPKENVLGYKDYQSMAPILIKEAKRRLLLIKKYTSKKNLLDLGCGTGTFLEIAKKEGYNVAGSDISSYAGKNIEKKKIPFFPGDLTKSKLPRSAFEIVTAWDVFEHIASVNKAFENVNRTLKPGSFLFLTTPNLQSWDARLMRGQWYGFKKIPEHNIFFSPKSITNVLENNGFKVVKIKTWGFERDLEFISEKLKHYFPAFNKISSLFSFLNLRSKSVYLPIIDMVVVAQKK